MATKHNASAPLPEPGYRPPPRRSKDGLAVTVVGEDGEDFGTFDFSDIDVPRDFLLSLVGGFEKATGSQGRWRTRGSVRQGAGVLRQFATTVVKLDPDIESISDLSPESWWAWVGRLAENGRWPGAANQARSLLRDTDGLPSTTRRALNGRLAKPKTREYEAYSRSEFRRIRAQGWRVVRSAARRIGANAEELALYRAGEEPADSPKMSIRYRSYSRGELLEQLALTGTIDHPALQPHRRKELREFLRLDNDSLRTAHALFPTSVEIMWLMATFVCERGYNASVIEEMTVDVTRADDHRQDPVVYVADLDKPRRGPAARFFTNSFTQQSADLLGLAIAMTQPARDTMGVLGYPTNQLLVARVATGRSTHATQQFKTEWSAFTGRSMIWSQGPTVLGDDGEPLALSFRRMRLTEQVVNRRARQNSDEVSESLYRRPDPQTREQAAGVITKGQEDALRHANETLQMRTTGWQHGSDELTASAVSQDLNVDGEVARGLLSGRLDTATAACLDFTNSPFAAAPGQPCPASFFACFACTNAVATPDHLPRLVALFDALKRIWSTVSREVWNSDYAAHFARLDELLDANASAAEIEHARRKVRDEDVEVIDRLLRRGWDA